MSADHALQRGQNQYQTPDWLARACQKLRIGPQATHILDPQCANGNLMAPYLYQNTYGTDIDNRFKASVDGHVRQRITGNCVRVFAVADELKLEMKFNAIVANPPFGIRWKLPGDKGGSIDSTVWTWELIKKRLIVNGAGYLITTPKAIENNKIHEDPWVYLYQKLPGGGIWDNCNVELGIVHFCNWEVARTEPRFDMVWDHVPSEMEMVSNPNQQPCQVIDVRIKMGKEQAKLYAYWLDRKNYMAEFKNPLTIALVQLARLRGVCAAPASLDYTRGMCKSNFNPKTVTILQLIRDIIGRGEQVVVVSARVGQSSELSKRLSDAGVPIARIDSTVEPGLHAAEANRFKKGHAKVMLMGIMCAQAHSFDRCSNLIVGSLEWAYGKLHQAEGRVWRLTSPRPVKVWCVLHERSIEELLFDKVAQKQDAATMCLHGKRVPHNFKTMEPGEILAEHVVSFDEKGETLSETECEIQWPTLRKQLVRANINVVFPSEAAA